jgi:hypothetical protein
MYYSIKGIGAIAPPEKSYVDLDGVKAPLGTGEPTNATGVFSLQI